MEYSSKKNRLWRIGLTLGVLVVGAAGTILTVKFKTKAESKPSERKLPSVRVITAKPDTYTFQIQSQGTALPRTTIPLVSEVSGKVVSMSKKFDAGQVFNKNDILLTIDQRDYELALAQAKATLAQADLRLQMEVKEAAVVRREWKLINQVEPTGLQAREPQLAEAKAALAAAQVAMESAKHNLQRCKIRAPFEGMVAKTSVRPGQFVTLSTKLGEIFSTDFAEVRLPLTASELNFIELPSPGASILLDQAPAVTLNSQVGNQSLEWHGRIVRSEETVDPLNRLIYVVAQIKDPYGLAKHKALPLRSGTFVQAVIKGRTQEKVFVLPRQALRGKDRIWIATPAFSLTLQHWLGYREHDQPSYLIFRSVDVLYTDAKDVVITGSVKTGEQIITSLLAGVINGMEVNIQSEASTNP